MKKSLDGAAVAVPQRAAPAKSYRVAKMAEAVPALQDSFWTQTVTGVPSEQLFMYAARDG